MSPPPQSFRLTKMLTRNNDIDRRIKAGREYADLLPGGVAPLSASVILQVRHPCGFAESACQVGTSQICDVGWTAWVCGMGRSRFCLQRHACHTYEGLA